MPASLVQTVKISAPDYNRSGSQGGRYEATWLVEVDDYVPGKRAIELAQLDASSHRVPLRGEALSWGSASETFNDSGAFALDFSAVPKFRVEEGSNLWEVTVTWRPPEPGQDEQPGTITLPPLGRPPEYWIEYSSLETVYAEGYVVNPLDVALLPGLAPVTFATGELKPLQNGAGEPFTVPAQKLLPIIVCQKNVSSDLEGLKINNDFEDTVNSKEWNARGLTVAAHHGLFVRAETSQQLFEDNFSFYRMQVRVAIGKLPFYDRRPHTSVKVWESNLPKSHINSDGTFAPNGPIFGAGIAPTTEEEASEVLEWLLYEPVDYDPLGFSN